MWIQTVFPESPFYNLKYVFPTEVWSVFVTLQFLYGPLVVLSEKKFNLKVLYGFLIYPFYCINVDTNHHTGIMSKNNKDWSHTQHSRKISISDLEKA